MNGCQPPDHCHPITITRSLFELGDAGFELAHGFHDGFLVGLAWLAALAEFVEGGEHFFANGFTASEVFAGASFVFEFVDFTDGFAFAAAGDNDGKSSSSEDHFEVFHDAR